MHQTLATCRAVYPFQPVAEIPFRLLGRTLAAQDDERQLEEKLRQLMAEADRLRKREAELLKELERLKGPEATKAEPGAD